MNFILSRFWFFFCLTSWGATVTDCAMRLGKLMNWRQYDRVFIARLRFDSPNVIVSLSRSQLRPYPAMRYTQERNRLIFLLLSFFRRFCFFPSLVSSFFTRKIKSFALKLPKIQPALTVLVPLDRRSHTIRCFVILICNRQNRIFLLLPTSLWIHVHWIIEEEIKYSVLWVRCHLESLSHRFIHTEEGEIHAR